MSEKIEHVKNMAVAAGAVITPTTEGIFFNNESLARFVQAVADAAYMRAVQHSAIAIQNLYYCDPKPIQGN